MNSFQLPFTAINPFFLLVFRLIEKMRKGSYIFYCLVTVLPCTSNQGQGQGVDTLSTETLISNKHNDSELFLKLFVEYRSIDIDSARYFAELSSREALQFADSLMFVRSQIALGYALHQKGLHDQAVVHYLNALATSKNNGYKDREKFVLNFLGLLYYNSGRYDQALDYYFKSLALRETDGNKSEIAIACNNIGLVYYRIGDLKTAIEFFERSLQIKKSVGDKSNIESTLNNLGLSYSGLSQYQESLKYFSQVLEICERGCSNDILIQAYNGSGISLFKNGELDSAEVKFLKSNEIAINSQAKVFQVVNYNYLADLKLQKNEVGKALELLDTGQLIAKQINSRPWIKTNYRLYGRIYSIMNNFETAYSYQRKYDSLNSEILNENVISNLARIQADYLERENLQTIASQDEEISRRTTLLILSVIIIFLISVILFILYRINQLRKKTNQQLSEANAIIEQQNKELMDVNNVLEEKVKERTKELKDTNAALLKSNTDLDNFIYKTSHDIRGPLATLQGMCNIALMDIEEPKSVDYFEKIGRTADRLNEILSKLLVINQINNSLITSNPIDVKRLIKDILIEYQQSPGANKIRVDNQVERMDNFKSDEVLLKIILNNLISNAYKFYNSSNRVDSWIRIDASQCNNGHVEFNVIDNGIGIDETAAGKIFEIFSKASEVSDSAGLGLYLVKLAVEKLDGTIAHSKTKEGYTQFKVELPHR